MGWATVRTGDRTVAVELEDDSLGARIADGNVKEDARTLCKPKCQQPVMLSILQRFTHEKSRPPLWMRGLLNECRKKAGVK